MFDSSIKQREAISDGLLGVFRQNYKDESITKEDIFCHVYGVLSSPEYAARFGDDTKKVLARVPYVDGLSKFREFGDLHVNYESKEMWPIHFEGNSDDLRVTKMRIVERNGEKVIRYNDGLTISGIPVECGIMS